jgi:hypothetical protein
MPLTHINAVVRLTMDIPKLRLRCGDEGVVVGVWVSPGDFDFEVEFRKSDRFPAVRTILRAEQLEVIRSGAPRPAME